ncbi:conserved hypothetical protein [Uncinocarpus reesii 1704]|uniref:Uncharacterized protein n=1 Tax=Uncinocarpus reesii (strain UAMH 1704) TaxID=336963 RepID=C4JLU8_UNCRE|nr:uncharacterized protein UREG_03806 [Uncinocarpus reesii 1704]EEP78960.1 conserved hypothetical protein [Uncinocarpus reesii 1704]
MYIKYLLYLTAVITSAAATEPKSVFAHFIVSSPRIKKIKKSLVSELKLQVGNAASMTLDEWKADIKLAKEAHIDGFALNIAPQDSYTDSVLQKAYKAAGDTGGFTLFLSFDYASGGPWQPDRVIRTINTYRNQPAQFQYNNKPLVSTFEGASNTNDWPAIKRETGCFFVPSWTSLGPQGVRNVVNTIDGAFSWDAWAVGTEEKTLEADKAWIGAIGSKPYMMPVSPWFYTNLPQWNKNWLWRGDDLWHDRWEQVIELQPTFVQIITWNDFGESHYISPIHENGIPHGAEWYVRDNPHDGWRALLPDYIDRYKSGNLTMRHPSQSPSPDKKDIISYWYRRNPANSGSAGGTRGNNPAMGQPVLNPSSLSQDRVFLSVLAKEPSDVSVQIGNSTATKLKASVAGINHFSVPFNGRTGRVTIVVSRRGTEIVRAMGPEITTECHGGKVNWNAVAGSSMDKKERT